MLRQTLSLAGSILAFHCTATAQVFVTGLGGAAALSGASAISSAAAANYDPKIGPAANFAIGYHFNDWFSAEAGYIWNQNRVVASQLSGSVFSQNETVRVQHAAFFDAMVYFRARLSRVRPYLSAGPAIVTVLDQPKPGLRVAVGVDVRLRSGWGVRYSFSEMITANPLGAALQPPVNGKLMNFQNLIGVIKIF